MRKNTKRLSWARNPDMVALLEKVYAWYVSSEMWHSVSMMELKWATAFTFARLANRFQPEFGAQLDYADYAYSAFCQIDVRFRMRTGRADSTKMRDAEREVSRWWLSALENKSIFIVGPYTSWPDIEREIFEKDKVRRNSAASVSNAKRRIKSEHVQKSDTAKVHQSFSTEVPLSSVSEVARGLMKRYPHDPLVLLSITT